MAEKNDEGFDIFQSPCLCFAGNSAASAARRVPEILPSPGPAPAVIAQFSSGLRNSP